MTDEKIEIWHVGNTGLRNPNRIQEGFSVYANSSFAGNLHGHDNEIGFMNLLNEKGIIQNESGKDASGSHARKWRLMFAKNGFIYPQISKKDGNQDDLGKLDAITPFGKTFLKADTLPAVQECFLRAMSVEQIQMPDKSGYFSPLRWMLAIMLELERRTGSSEIGRMEFALWGHSTNPSYDVNEVVDNILDLRERHILFDISDLPLTTAVEINIARQRLENILAQTDEIRYAEEQRDQWQEISDYMTLLIKGGGKKDYGDENVIEVPKDETPAYLEWTLWRAALAIDHLVNKPYEIRGFRLDSDFLPVSAAGGGKGDLYCEFNDFMILTEVTMSTSSRQEAMEGEPVRRHVSDAVLKHNKPVYGMFIAVKIDTNTAETFRHGVWYAKGDVKQRLDIVPLTLAQFQRYFESMFMADKARPEQLRDLILQCEEQRDELEAPAWKEYIDSEVTRKMTQW